MKGSQVHFRTPKTAKGKRTITLTPSTMLMLNEYRNKEQAEALLLCKPILDSDLVFGDLENKPLLPDTISHAWWKLIKRLGLRYIRLYDARHTHASILLKKAIHPKIVQERLGHTTISTTLDIYSHVTLHFSSGQRSNLTMLSK